MLSSVPGWLWWGGAAVFLFSQNRRYETFHTEGRIYGDLVSDAFNERVTSIATKLVKDKNNEQSIKDLANYLMADMYAESHLNPHAHLNETTDEDGKHHWHSSVSLADINNTTIGGGFIGFMRDTAQALYKKKGVSFINKQQALNALLTLTPVQQLEFVDMFFAPYKGKINSLLDLRIITFWPAALGEGPDYVLPMSPKTYAANIRGDLNRDGKITIREVGDHITQVYNEGIERLKKK